ncbi:MAG: OmpH family outer membrane protein [Candidatus Pelagibacter sp.]
MKYFVNLFVIIIIIIFPQVVKSNDKIVYININKIINQSIAGDFINRELEKLHNTNLLNLNKIKDELQKEEKKILSKKNIISEDEYLKQINLLKVKVNNYQNKQKIMLKELNDKKVAAKKELMDNLNSILTNFANNNDISYILNKKNVVIAKKDLDITDDIIILLNQKIKKIALK